MNKIINKSNSVKTFRNITISVIFFFVLLVQFVPLSHAQSNPKSILRVSPVILNLALDPGKTITQELTVENLLDTPLPVRLTLNDFGITDEDGGYSFPDSQKNPLLSWITLETKDMIIPAKSKRTIQMTIQIPKTVPVGGYYGVVFFEPVFPAISKTTQINAKVGMVMLANIGIPNSQKLPGEIVQFNLPNFIQNPQNIDFFLRVKNSSLYHFTAKPILTFKPIFGKPTKVIVEDKVVFPGKTRRWNVPVSPEIGYGIYNTKLAVALGNGKQITTNTLVFVIPVTQIMIALIILGGIVLIFRNKTRIKKALKTLIKG